jgi:hypothetical protein
MFTKDNERKSRKVKENHEKEGIVGWRESLYCFVGSNYCD